MIKKIIMRFNVALLLIWSQTTLAGVTGLLFNLSSTGTPADVSITLCLNGKEPLSCQNYTVSALFLTIQTTIPNHVYPNAGIKINTPGFTFTDCASNNKGYCLFSVSSDNAKSISISQASRLTQYAYVADQINSNVYQCGLNADGTFNSNTCTATPIPAPIALNMSAWQPRSLTFATVNHTQYAYVSDSNDAQLFQCTLNPDNTFINCASILFPVAALSTVFPTINGTQYAYISKGLGGVDQCNLYTDGTIDNCHPTPQSSPSWVAFSTTFAIINEVQYAYVADGNFFSGGHIYQCNVRSDGSFDSCNSTPQSMSWTPNSMTFATVDGTQYAYVTSVGNVYQCSIQNDGSLYNCNPTPASISWNPNSIAFSTVNGEQYAYVSDQSNGLVYQCHLNADGSFVTNGCTPTPPSALWSSTSCVTFN